MDTLIYAVVFLLGAIYVLHPILWGSSTKEVRPPVSVPGPGDDASGARADIIDAIRDLDFEFETGKLSPDDHAELRASYRLRALKSLGREDRAGSTKHCAECGSPSGGTGVFCAVCGAQFHATGVPAAPVGPGEPA